MTGNSPTRHAAKDPEDLHKLTQNSHIKPQEATQGKETPQAYTRLHKAQNAVKTPLFISGHGATVSRSGNSAKHPVKRQETPQNSRNGRKAH